MATSLDGSRQNNPLLNPPALPYGAPPLDLIKTEHFMPALKEAITLARQDIEAIRNNPEAPTFKNTIEALEFSGRDMKRISSIFGNISAANSDEGLRGIEKGFKAEAVKYASDLMMDAAIFARVKSVYDGRATLSLDKEEKMLLENTYKDFARSGALITNEKDRQELRDINEKLSDLATSFKNNTLKSTAGYRKVISDEKELAGVPERALDNYRKAAEEEGMPGKFVIKLSPPPLDILDYCENRALREEIYRARTSIAFGGEYDNRPVIMETIKLRQRRAELLGYKNHAAFVLDDRMAKTPEAVMEFLEKNEKVYRQAAEEHLKKVRNFAFETDGLSDFKPWDFSIYNRKLQEKTFNLDLEELRPYFDLEKVLEGLRIHTEKLFNITMQETKGKYPTYHPDVKVYELHNKDSGEMLGVVHADYYARPGAKRSGAWMNTFRENGEMDAGGAVGPAIGTNVTNFDKGTKDKPTLLSLDEVRTVFHEFGHWLQGMMSTGKYPSLNGTNVKWDYVEVASQFMENYTRQKEVLDTFATHYKTGEQLPADLIKKISEMETFGAGYTGLRQTFQALLDMKAHMTDPSAIKSVEEMEDEVINKSWLFPREGGTMSTSFSHIFSGGYSAGYYSYKWAEVLEADIFEDFEKEGLYQRQNAKRLGDTVYSEGGKEDPMKVFIKYKGREPDPNALFRREGLLPNDNKKKDSKPAPPKSKHGP